MRTATQTRSLRCREHRKNCSSSEPTRAETSLALLHPTVQGAPGHLHRRQRRKIWSSPRCSQLRGQRGATLAKDFQGIISELSIANGCLVRGHRIVIPKALQGRVLRSLHSGHFGVVKMKSLTRRDHVWWFGMDKDIENITKSYSCFEFLLRWCCYCLSSLLLRH